jgi:hypothetical protein
MSSYKCVVQSTLPLRLIVQILDVAVRERDADSLEHIVVSMFDFHLDYQLAPQLRGVRDEYVQIAKTRLAAPQVCYFHSSIPDMVS